MVEMRVSRPAGIMAGRDELHKGDIHRAPFLARSLYARKLRVCLGPAACARMPPEAAMPPFQGFETRLVHAGQPADPGTGAVMTPIFQTSTYKQAGVGQSSGYEYSRTGNPTRTALEACLADLEGGTRALAFASGMAALDAVFHLLPPRDPLPCVNDPL